MKFPDIFENVAALAWLGVSLVATPAVTAQTIISNETLVSTTLIVNTKDAKAICRTTGCRAKTAYVCPDQCHLSRCNREDLYFPHFPGREGFVRRLL